MALLNKIRRDTKKSSYYVWFLGAQESKGLRGVEYITPVLKSLIEREKTVEPFKITLQVSHKGLKIIQNLSSLNAKPFLTKGDIKPEQKPNKNDVIKHFIPHHAVTCVLQEDDVVACILLLYNPVTRCPVHVHAYRCDSKETASLLTNQLTTLILRPDNQKKMNEIEGRLRAKGLLLPTVPRVNIPKRVNSLGSEGRSTTSPASESSGGSAGSPGGCQNERITNLYDSLAAELREKLGMGTDSKSSHAPILLPPRDYDTVHRQKGNLAGIEMRRCLNENIVGMKTKKEPQKEVTDKKNLKGGPLGRILESSGGSSGIGSDHPPSPDQNGRYLDNQSTSDDEWVEHPSEDSLFLMPQEGRNNSWRNGGDQMSLPRAKRYGNNRVDSQTDMDRGESDSPNRVESGFYRSDDNLLRKRSSSPRYQKKDGSDGSKRSDSPRDYVKNGDDNMLRNQYRKSNRGSSPVNLRNGNRHNNSEAYRRSYSPSARYDRKEIVDEPLMKMSSAKTLEESVPREKSSISIENFRKKNDKGNMSPVGVVAPRRRTSEESRGKGTDSFWDEEDSYKRRIPGYKEKIKPMEEDDDDVIINKEYNQKMKKIEENVKMSSKEKKLRENTMKLSPQERFLDAKSKFLMLEKERLKEQDKNAQNLEKKRCIQDEAPISPEIIKNRPSWNRSDESKTLKNQKAELVRRNSFFEIDNNDKYFEKEPRGKSLDHVRDSNHEQEIPIKRLSRSDSRSRFFSQERLTGDLDYEIRYRSDSPKKYREDDGPRRMKSRDEREFSEHRRHSRGDYGREWERERERFASPSREIRKYSNNRRQSPSDDENYQDEDRYRYEKKRYDKERSYSNGRETPPRSRCEEDEDLRRRRCDEDANDVPTHFKSPSKNRLNGRGEMDMSSKAVPYDKNKKSKYEMLEKEKRLSSNALAKEFKRRSYQDPGKFDKIESDKRMSYIDRDYDGRYCDEYPDEMGYSDKADVRRRNQYNLANLEFKRNSHELAKEFNRRSRAFSYESDEDCKKQRPSPGYQEMKERERYPGLDRESSRALHHPVDDCHPDSKLSRMNQTPDDHDRYIDSPPRMMQIQVDRMPARYRHSFVDNPPGLSVMAPSRGHEMLHRTNSSVSSNRVGIAAVHPY